MATIGEITQAASYKGDAGLGGYIPSAIQLDNKPVEQLMAFTVMQNKVLYDQRIKDGQDKIDKLAEISKYDIVNARGKDKKMAIAAMAELQKYTAQYAKRGTPKSPQDKINQELELQTKIQDATSKIQSLNARGIGYQARLNGIKNTSSNGAEKAEKIRQLDEEFDKGEWDTPIALEEKFSGTPPALGDAVYTTNTTSVKTGNSITQQAISIFNPGKNMDASTVDEAGLVSYVTLPPDATPEQTREFNLRKAKGGEINILSDAAKFLQDALSNEKYKNTDGTINAEAVNADNAMAGGILNMVERSNEYNKQLGTDIAKGVYVTKMGGQVSLANVVRKEDLVFIDKNKPLSVRQIIYLNRFGKAAPDTKTEKIDFTGENIQEKNAETARQNIYLDAAIQREGQANALKIAKLPYEQIKLTSGGQPLSTMEYDPLASIVAASGGLNKVLDPAKLSKAQIAAINPSWIDAEGQLTAEAMAAKISVGVVGKGEDGGYDYGVFILDNKTLKAKTSLNQSNLLSNGASWITTNAKETKGQDVYKYNPELLRKSLGIKSAPAKGEVDEYGVPVIK